MPIDSKLLSWMNGRVVLLEPQTLVDLIKTAASRRILTEESANQFCSRLERPEWAHKNNATWRSFWVLDLLWRIQSQLALATVIRADVLPTQSVSDIPPALSPQQEERLRDYPPALFSSGVFGAFLQAIDQRRILSRQVQVNVLLGLRLAMETEMETDVVDAADLAINMMLQLLAAGLETVGSSRGNEGLTIYVLWD